MFKNSGAKASPSDSMAGVGKFQRSSYGVGKMQKSAEEVKKGMAPPTDFSGKK